MGCAARGVVPRLPFEAMLVWMGDRPLQIGRAYLVKRTSRIAKGNVSSIRCRMDPNERRQPRLQVYGG